MVDEDVHTEHCCKWHGCKYDIGNGNGCTVESGQKLQSFPCEYCDWAIEEYKKYQKPDDLWLNFMETHGKL